MKGSPIPVVTGYKNDGAPIIVNRIRNVQELVAYYEMAIVQAIQDYRVTLIG